MSPAPASPTREQLRQLLVNHYRQHGRGMGRDRLMALAQEQGLQVTRSACQMAVEQLDGYRVFDRLLNGKPSAPALPADAEHRLKKENAALRRELTAHRDKIAENTRAARLFEQLTREPLAPPQWLTSARTRGDVAVATAMLSDTHFDEVVDPSAIEWSNAYNRAIAEKRLRKFFDNAVTLPRDFFAGIEYQGLVLALAGDMVSGDIHDELSQTNEASSIDTCLHYASLMAAGIESLLRFYPKIHVPCVVGNHGRDSDKPRAKGQVQHNWDYLLYRLIEQHFDQVPEVTFSVALGQDASWTVYSTRYRMMHGHNFRGGTGISGALAPLMLGEHRTRKSRDAIGRGFDYLLLGHFHQRMSHQGLIVNGSLKGYDEYAYNKPFGFQKPEQSFWLTDPKRGKTLEAPIHVLGDDEGWQKQAPVDLDWLRSA